VASGWKRFFGMTFAPPDFADRIASRPARRKATTASATPGWLSATVENQSRLVGGYRRSNSRRCSGSSKSRGLSGGSGTSPVVNTADQAPFRRNPRLTLKTAIAMTKMNTMISLARAGAPGVAPNREKFDHNLLLAGERQPVCAR
jgi:hypothetical protein